MHFQYYVSRFIGRFHFVVASIPINRHVESSPMILLCGIYLVRVPVVCLKKICIAVFTHVN